MGTKLEKQFYSLLKTTVNTPPQIKDKKDFKLLKDKKQLLLNSLKSTNPQSKNKYKRLSLSPIRYAGGKSLAVGFIVELIPNNIKRLISPFFGGGSVELACNKYLNLEVKGFDIFDILVNYWQQQIDNPNELYNKLIKLSPTKIQYQKIKNKLKNHWERKSKLHSLSLATSYYFNHNLSYGPSFLGWASNVYLNRKRYLKLLEKVKKFNVKNLSVECVSFEEVFKKYPNDFFYCDPPYFLGEDSKMFKGIYPQRNFPIHHNNFDHIKLRDLLLSHKGGFILSYNDCPTIRNWYKSFNFTFPKWQYTMGQGEKRIGINRAKNTNSNIKLSHELIIINNPRG